MKRSNTGFTLVELLLYIGITAIMLSSIVSFFFLFIDARVRHHAQRIVEQEGERIMYTLREVIEESSSISLPAFGTTLSELQVIAYDPVLGERALTLVGNTLMLTDLSGSSAVHSPQVRVDDFTVQNLGSSTTVDSLIVTYTVSIQSSSGRSEYAYADTFTTTITKR